MLMNSIWSNSFHMKHANISKENTQSPPMFATSILIYRCSQFVRKKMTFVRGTHVFWEFFLRKYSFVCVCEKSSSYYKCNANYWHDCLLYVLVHESVAYESVVSVNKFGIYANDVISVSIFYSKQTNRILT